MPTAADIKHWLALVANARIAAGIAAAHQPEIGGIHPWPLRQVHEYLEDAYLIGLEAHGQAMLREYLAESETARAAS